MKKIKFLAAFMLMLGFVFTACNKQGEVEIQEETQVSASELFEIYGEIDNSIYNVDELKSLVIAGLIANPELTADASSYEKAIATENINVIKNAEGHYVVASWVDVASGDTHGAMGTIENNNKKGDILLKLSCYNHGCFYCTSSCGCKRGYLPAYCLRILDEDHEEKLTAPDSDDYSFSLTIPKGYDNMSDEALNTYFDNLTEQDWEALKESYTISSYLETVGLWEKVTTKMTKGQRYTDVDLSQYLTSKQLIVLANFEAPITTPKCIGSWQPCPLLSLCGQGKKLNRYGCGQTYQVYCLSGCMYPFGIISNG